MKRTVRLLLAALIVLSAACGSDEGIAEHDADSEIDIEAIVADLNEYWSSADDALGFDYVPVSADRVTNGEDGVLCDGAPIDYDEVEDNAFVDSECSEGITVAYDEAYLTATHARAESTLSHEWGHVIQAQMPEIDLSEDSQGLPIDAELQADCLAGAWAAPRAESDIEQLRREMSSIGDDGDVPADDPDAHGTADERVAAFDLGLDDGPAACTTQLVDLLPG